MRSDIIQHESCLKCGISGRFISLAIKVAFRELNLKHLRDAYF